jgi:hypothetical protein
MPSFPARSSDYPAPKPKQAYTLSDEKSTRFGFQVHYKSYRHFRRPEAAENKLFSAAKGLFSAASGRQKNRPKIRLCFRRPEPGRRK